MKITDLLDKRSISLSGAPTSKSEALDQMVELMAKSGKIDDTEAYRKAVYAREEESTTGIGEGLAIPHGNVTQSTLPDWLPWSSKTALISTHWTEHRFP